MQFQEHNHTSLAALRRTLNPHSSTMHILNISALECEITVLMNSITSFSPHGFSCMIFSGSHSWLHLHYSPFETTTIKNLFQNLKKLIFIYMNQSLASFHFLVNFRIRKVYFCDVRIFFTQMPFTKLMNIIIIKCMVS